MITALLHLFHLLDHWRIGRRSDRRADPWTDPVLVRPPGAGRQRRTRLGPRPHLRALRSDAGMTTAEYAVGTVAAVAFAVVLFKVVQSPAVHGALSAIVTGALNVHL
jgi:hypothetical protein